MLAGAAAPLRPAVDATPYSIVELRQYTLHDGKRDTLIDLFECYFIEPQEALGMKVIGTFRDLDRPNRFVWLRGFTDMDSRLAGLTDFYGGPVWKTHREAANATMIDSDDVLLLHARSDWAAFKSFDERPSLGGKPGGLVVATIYHLRSPAEAERLFETTVKPELEKAGVPVLAWFMPQSAPNNYPRLPVREGEPVLVWFARFDNEAVRAAHASAVESATAPLQPLLENPPEILRLEPTARSSLR